MQGKIVDVTPLFQACGIQTDKITVLETPGMYPYKEKVQDNWAYFTAAGLLELKKIFDAEGKVITDAGIVGICSGVEAIALLQILKGALRRVIVTDVDEGILEGTLYNLQNFSRQAGITAEVIPLVGSFCEPVEKQGYSVDFVHANIPNLPASGTEDLSKGAEKGTFLPALLYEGYKPPEKFVGWALGAQYAYLQSAKAVLNEGGTVMTELGGRIPLELVEELFHLVGLTMHEVVVGFKEQTEALIDFVGYHRLEEQYGVEFEFYLYNESFSLFKKKGLQNPTAQMTGKEIKEMLKPFKVSAGQALELYHQQIPIGHTVHLFRGVK